jgi:4-aminobutyrate aminotransferase-like enzyme
MRTGLATLDVLESEKLGDRAVELGRYMRLALPLIVTPGQIDRAVDALREIVALMRSPGEFWTETLGLAKRAANI